MPQELLELVLLLCPPKPVVVGGVPPRVNCTLGGDNWHMSGMGGAEIFLTPMGLAVGDLGLVSGLTRACKINKNQYLVSSKSAQKVKKLTRKSSLVSTETLSDGGQLLINLSSRYALATG